MSAHLKPVWVICNAGTDLRNAGEEFAEGVHEGRWAGANVS